MATVTRGGFAKRLCDAFGLPATQRRLNALVAWQAAEGTKARFNPLATTRSMPGATNFNRVGVKDYPDLKTGVEATRLTLRESGHGYDLIVTRFEINAAAKQILEAVAGSHWGTGELALQVLPYVKDDYDRYAGVAIGQ